MERPARSKKKKIQLRAFLSYSNKDKILAGRIKEELEDYGLFVFLAHHDIEPSDEWVDEILKELERCHVFLPLLTNDFNKSYWTDQESGIAFHLEKLIIPLKIDVDPHGFIGKYQGLKVSPKRVKSACKKIVQKISTKPRLGKLLRNGVIRVFRSSESYADAGIKSELVVSFRKYTERQIEIIIRSTLDNSQIRGSFKAQDLLRPFIRDYEDIIDEELLRKFYKATRRP